MKKTIIVVCLLVVAIVLGVIIMNIIGGKEKGNNISDKGSITSKETKKETKSSEKGKVYGLGEYVKTEHYEVAIVKVTKPTKWRDEPEEGKEYVAVEISVKNISDEDGAVSQSEFQYKGEDGKLHGRYPNTFSGFDVEPETFGAEDLEIGQTFNGTIVYLLPKNMTEVELWYRESYTTTPDAAFKFSK